jgi:small-conductance mechanosensitive channel
MKNLKSLFLSSLFLVTVPLCADLLSSLGLKNNASFDVVIGDDKIAKNILAIKKELNSLETESRVFEETQQARAIQIKSLIAQVESEIKTTRNQDDTYLNKQLFSLKSSSQALVNMRTARKNWISFLKARLTLLEGLEEDRNIAQPEERKSLYSFEELQDLNRRVLTQEDKVAHIQTEQNEIRLDLENTKKRLDSIEKQHKEKLKEQVDFGQEVAPGDDLAKQKSKLLDIEVKAAQYDKELAQLRVKEKTAQLILLEERNTLESKKLAQLLEKRDFITRMSLRVDQEDIVRVTEKLRSEKRSSLNKIDRYMQSIDKLSSAEEEAREQLADLETRYIDRVGETTNLNEWISTPETLDEFTALSEKGLKNDELLLIEGKVDLARAQMQLEKIGIKERELDLEVVESWYKIKHQLFKSSEELSKEIAHYQEMTAEFKREKLIYEDKRQTATNRLNLQNKALTNLRAHIETFTNKKSDFLVKNKSDYDKVLKSFRAAKASIAKQIEITGSLIEIYSKIVVSFTTATKEVNSMLAELQRVSLWQRSGGAISREGLANIFPDIKTFISDVRALGVSYFASFSFSHIFKRVGVLLTHPLSLVIFLWKLFLVIFIFLLLYRYIPVISRIFMAVGTEYKGAFLFSRIAALFTDFFSKNLISLYIWTLLFIFIGSGGATEIYPSVIFYLLSIPYWLYISFMFIEFIRKFNEEHNQELFVQQLASRFLLLASIFLYTTIVVIFFREAFLLTSYTQSELPSVLLAFYSIIVRILLLAVIRKEDLLTIIPSKTQAGAFFWRMVDQYYYFLLSFVIIIMILSDPHIGGYDNLVSYVFWGVFGTLLVTRSLYALYSFTRRMSSYAFFSSDGETLSERFTNSKTWYGFTVVLLFLVFVLLGLWSVAWFWGKAIPLNTIGSFLGEKRFAIGFTDGQYQNVSIFDLTRTLLFIPGSFFAAHLVDKFILDRIFNVLLVDPGVHNAVSSITYYVVVIFVFTLGLIQEGFGFLVVYYLLPLLVGMALALREIFNDFIAYFVLLIQRPFKVGDYVEVNDAIKGVVRKITPRAVILRRKRSFHLIVPNAKLMQEAIVNWDYTRSFVTFPDIIVGIRYASDPVLTKKVLMEAVETVNQVLKTPSPIIRLDDFGPSGYIFMIRGYISSDFTLLQWEIASDVRLAIVKLLHEHNIEIAFPVRVVRMMGESKHHQYLDPKEQEIMQKAEESAKEDPVDEEPTDNLMGGE